MKLSELSYREYVAIEVLPSIVARGEKASWLQVRNAFDVADAFLQFCGKEYDKVISAERRAEKAEAQASLLLNMNEDGDFPSRVALMQIWEILGVNNQTAAMQALNEMRDDRP